MLTMLDHLIHCRNRKLNEKLFLALVIFPKGNGDQIGGALQHVPLRARPGSVPPGSGIIWNHPMFCKRVEHEDKMPSHLNYFRLAIPRLRILGSESR